MRVITIGTAHFVLSPKTMANDKNDDVVVDDVDEDDNDIANNSNNNNYNNDSVRQTSTA